MDTMARTPRFLLRLFTIAVTTLLLLPIVWLFMPFPSIGHDTYWYPTYRMRSAKTLTRVYNTDAFFPVYPTESGGASTHVKPFQQQYFALDFTLYNNILQVNNASIELRSSIASLVSHQTRGAVNARVATPSGIIPSFWPFGDAAELQWQGEQQYAGIPLIIRRQFDDLTHLFELLPDLSNLPANTSEAKPPSVDALIRLRWDENRMSEEYNTIEAVVSDSPYSQSPSHTYLIRYLMLPIITGPIAFLVETYGGIIGAMFEVTGQTLGTALFYAYFATLGGLAAWFWSGRPAAEAILRSANRRVQLQRLEDVARRLEDLRVHEADQHGSLRMTLIISAFIGRSHRYVSEARRKRLADKVDLEKGSNLD